MNCDLCGGRTKSRADDRCEDCLLSERVASREAAIGTGLCADCTEPCDLDKGICADCQSPRGTSKSTEASNPYKKVWNTVEDEEKFILDSVRNNALFIPTPAILADRHRASARHWTRQAERQGTVVGRAALKQAQFHAEMAESMDRYGDDINRLKRPKDFSFTVVKDN